MTFRDDYRQKYEEMRRAATPVAGALLGKLTAACQRNPWLKRHGIDFEPEGFCVESDYPYYLERYDDAKLLERFFDHGNWGIRAAVQYRDLLFVNQVNGGDEWWTLKLVGDELVPFESITFRPMIQRGEFLVYLERLHRATVEQCQTLSY